MSDEDLGLRRVTVDRMYVLALEIRQRLRWVPGTRVEIVVFGAGTATRLLERLTRDERARVRLTVWDPGAVEPGVAA